MTDLQHTPFDPTPEQRANLLRLAAHLDLGVTNLQFDMGQFENECGTVGCACGHGPSLGIAKCDDESWQDYSNRAFGTNYAAYNGGYSYTWLFNWAWKMHDNTPRGAAARIRYALTKGIPENRLDQILGVAKLSYTVPDRVEGPTIAKPAVDPAVLLASIEGAENGNYANTVALLAHHAAATGTVHADDAFRDELAVDAAIRWGNAQARKIVAGEWA